jgi:hypothetical protein
MAGTGIPLCWMGDGRVSDEFDDEDQKARIRVPRVWVLAIVTVVGFIFMMKTAPVRAPFVNPKITAEPYVWPEGCQRREYKELDIIDRKCIQDKYYIGSGENWGWPKSSKRASYYRVGNDAFDMGCSVFSNECHVTSIVKNTFVERS